MIDNWRLACQRSVFRNSWTTNVCIFCRHVYLN